MITEMTNLRDGTRARRVARVPDASLYRQPAPRTVQPPPRRRWPIYPDRRTAEAIARWQPPGIAVMTALVAGATLAPWAYMWTLAFTLYAACKWITWWPSRSHGSWRRSAAYLLAYAGMNAREFMSAAHTRRPGWRDYVLPTVNVLAGGATLLWLGSSRAFTSSHPMLAATIVMLGLALMVHFGALNLLALLWRSRGIAAEPLMRAPLASRSLADFWGRRWNISFRSLSHELIFEPLARRLGAVGAMAVAFLVSGLVHDLVISLPANAGYRRPTLYFLIQFAGLLLERTPLLRRLYARHPSAGRFYAIAFTLAPLSLLFHGPFVRRCILPFLDVIGGLL